MLTYGCFFKHLWACICYRVYCFFFSTYRRKCAGIWAFILTFMSLNTTYVTAFIITKCSFCCQKRQHERREEAQNTSGCQPRVAPWWNICIHDTQPLGIIGAQLWFPLKSPPEYHGNNLPRELRGSLNRAPIIPIGVLNLVVRKHFYLRKIITWLTLGNNRVFQLQL